MDKFVIQFDQLPPSVNNYLRPSGTYNYQTGKVQIHMYETKEAKDFKKRFGAYLKREIVKQKWDKDITKEGHWYLDCVFFQKRTNEDNNNYFKILCDALKTGGAIDDDKNLLVRPQWVMYDTNNPRFMAVLKRVDYIGIFKDEEDYGKFFEHNCMTCKKNYEKCTILRKAKEGRIQDDIENKVCKKRKG